MNIPVDLMIHIISNSTKCQEYLTKTYPYEFEIWTRFSTRNGKQCPFARAAIKQVFSKEHDKYGQDFLSSLGSQDWGNDKYQELGNPKSN